MRNVQVGDEVPAGATLARLRSSDYEASLNSAVGQQRSSQGTLDVSQAELKIKIRLCLVGLCSVEFRLRNIKRTLR